MSARLGVLCLALALAACGDRGKGKADPQAGLAAQLNPCESAEPAASMRTICDNEELAALDARIRETFLAEAADITPAGAQMLVQSQQRWLHAQRTACGVIDPDADLSDEQTECLQSKLRERADQAGRAVQEIGPYTFQRVEIVDAQAVTAEAADASGLGEEAPPAITRDIRFPRIDNAAPQAARFNQLVAQQPQFRLEDQTDEQINYEIAYAGPALISVRFDTYDMTLGGAHPNSSFRAVTVMMETGEPLAVADVFRAGSGWESFLARRAVAALTEKYREYQFTPPQADVRDAVTKPHLWLIREEGLVLLLPPYSFGAPHAYGGAEVLIPWADLARYLNPNAPAPIRAPA